MTIDKAKLRAAAEAAGPKDYFAPRPYEEDRHYDDQELKRLEFMAEADPATVLALLAEIERIELISRISCNHDGFKAVLAERDQLKAENEALRKQVSNLSPLNSFPKQTVTGSNRCLACGEYHHGLGNLPCPKMTPVAQANLAKEP